MTGCAEASERVTKITQNSVTKAPPPKPHHQNPTTKTPPSKPHHQNPAIKTPPPKSRHSRLFPRHSRESGNPFRPARHISNRGTSRATYRLPPAGDNGMMQSWRCRSPYGAFRKKYGIGSPSAPRGSGSRCRGSCAARSSASPRNLPSVSGCNGPARARKRKESMFRSRPSWKRAMRTDGDGRRRVRTGGDAGRVRAYRQPRMRGRRPALDGGGGGRMIVHGRLHSSPCPGGRPLSTPPPWTGGRPGGGWIALPQRAEDRLDHALDSRRNLASSEPGARLSPPFDVVPTIDLRGHPARRLEGRRLEPPRAAPGPVPLPSAGDSGIMQSWQCRSPYGAFRKKYGIGSLCAPRGGASRCRGSCAASSSASPHGLPSMSGCNGSARARKRKEFMFLSRPSWKRATRTDGDGRRRCVRSGRGACRFGARGAMGGDGDFRG